ncbi:AT-hook motif nuclear-localized protein 7-like [Zingiber officinale]|uniref:AT-hook motif nuclear-localized protein 7-like n=1 Tax=Zingiber officinale TaxID=94328 RepID=UPI001C4C720D|nr:AT-hook motif nuclear-localized protein 7-like [Zingiber officinale]
MEEREGVVPSPEVVEASGSYQPPPPAASDPEADAVRDKKPASEVAAATKATGVAVGPPIAVAGDAGEVSGLLKKKRGRPRKYGPDGTPLRPLNPMPLSASAPANVQYTSAAAVGTVMKRGRGRAVGLARKPSTQFSLQAEHLSPGGFAEQTTIAGEMVACSAGANFAPHIITVAVGEDVTMKIISFSQQGPQAICILSANGIISNVTLRQPDSGGGTLTYEGRFELLSLSGSFMPTENGGTRSRAGGLSVSLASPDGRVIGGGVAGLLVAASPVQVVVGSFLPSYQMEHKIKRSGVEVGSVSTPTSAIPLSRTDTEEAFSSSQSQPSSAIAKPGPSTTPGFRVENWSPPQSTTAPRSTAMDINISLPGG